MQCIIAKNNDIPLNFCSQTEDLRISLLNSVTETPIDGPLQEQIRLNTHLFSILHN